MVAERVKVWDPLVRIFHWSLVFLFFLTFITEDDFLTLHVYAGYAITGLIFIRLVWGLIGSRYARFSNFIYRPSIVWAYFKDVLLFRAKHYLGHNPAGGAMIILLLISIMLAVFTGLLVYGAEESSGPLAAWVSGASHGMEEALEEIHEFFANFTLLLVFFHVIGVLVASLQHHENLVRSMINGYKTIQHAYIRHDD